MQMESGICSLSARVRFASFLASTTPSTTPSSLPLHSQRAGVERAAVVPPALLPLVFVGLADRTRGSRGRQGGGPFSPSTSPLDEVVPVARKRPHTTCTAGTCRFMQSPFPLRRPHRADAGAGNIKISPPRVSSLFSRSSSIYTL